MGLKVVKSRSLGALPIHLFRYFCCLVYRLTTMHSVTDRRTDDHANSRRYPIIMYVAVLSATSAKVDVLESFRRTCHVARRLTTVRRKAMRVAVVVTQCFDFGND